MKVLLTAAPGGHSGYAYAIGYYLARMGVEVGFLAPASKEWLREKLSRLGRVIDYPMPRKPGESLLRSLHRWPGAFLRALRRVTRDYDALVSCGANISIPPALVAKVKGLRLYNVESIVRILDRGKTPRILYPLSDATLLHWEEQLRNYPKGVVVGPIVEPPEHPVADEGYLLVTAGTVGNKKLFDAVLGLDEDKVIVQTGRVDPEPYRRKRPEWTWIRFTDQLTKLIARAHVVITQFPGMTSATAALAYKKPVVMVPAPHLKLSASLENARIYAEKIKAAYTEDVTPEGIRRAIEEALRAPVDERPEPHGAMRAAEIITRGASRK